MLKEIAEALLIRVCHPTSAVVSLDGESGVIGVFLFDTEFGGKWMRVHEDAARVFLLTNHPEGCPSLYEKDIENIARLKEQIPFKPLRVLITGEDIGLKEVAL